MPFDRVDMRLGFAGEDFMLVDEEEYKKQQQQQNDWLMEENALVSGSNSDMMNEGNTYHRFPHSC